MVGTTDMKSVAQVSRILLTEMVSQHLRGTTPVVCLKVGQSPYQSTHPLLEVDAFLGDGRIVRLIHKRLIQRRLRGGASAKPSMVLRLEREPFAYSRILMPHAVDAPAMFGARLDMGQWSLLLERCSGRALYEYGELPVWEFVAGWLGKLHGRFQAGASWLKEQTYLLQYENNLYRAWYARADAFGGQPPLRLAALRLAIDNLLRADRTLLHGDFYASNILVDADSRPPVITVLDWELAGCGPGVLDLAALVSGNWSETQKRRMATAYYEELCRFGASPPDERAFLLSLDCARLFIAVQWLVWARRWSPPPAHRSDWAAEADRQAERLAAVSTLDV